MASGRRWLLVQAASVGIAVLMAIAGIPAAVLLGALAGGLICGRGLKVPRPGFVLGQAMIGVLVGSSVTLPLLGALSRDWLLVLMVAGGTLPVSLVVGWVVGKAARLDATTALWSSVPGIASGVVAMSGAFGARQGIVAFGQYTRVLMLVVVAAILSAILSIDAPGAAIPSLDIGSAAIFMALAIGCALITGRYRLPGINMFLPIVLTAILQIAGLVTFAAPGPLMWFAYAIVGLTVGTAFDTQQLRDATRAVPYYIAGSIVLIAASAAISWALVMVAGVTPLTAFLATIPGGLEWVAVLAVTAGADVGFVMMFQMTRFLLVLLIGIPLIRLVSRRLPTTSIAPRRAGDSL